MLPMEAIELDAFRRHYEGHTFWCGTLGGCGGQLTTKLYTDKVCHFAHHAGPDGLPHACGRHARGVNSADHLYVRPPSRPGSTPAAKTLTSTTPVPTARHSDPSSTSVGRAAPCAYI
jgi:hypothetical protein